MQGTMMDAQEELGLDEDWLGGVFRPVFMQEVRLHNHNGPVWPSNL